MWSKAVLGIVVLMLSGEMARAQFVPQRMQLRTDPITGQVAGGQPNLRTDPERIVGSVYINPVSAVAAASAGGGGEDFSGRLMDIRRAGQRELQRAEQDGATDAELDKIQKAVQERIDFELSQPTPRQMVPGAAAAVAPFFDPYGYGFSRELPFDSTRGLRNFQTPFSAPEALKNQDATRALIQARALGIQAGAEQLINLYHQPLIQIKVRVIEVVRNDSLQANSVLEYVSSAGINGTNTSGEPANGEFQNFRNISRFATEGLVENATTGSGLLLNLTTEHINWAVQLLSTELNADVVTAPQVVTLNGQNVEFVSGQKIPFQLGQNVIQGTNNNIQQFFYKNIGTYVSVTPKIVNWGFHGEGQGNAAIVAADVADWNNLATFMLDSHLYPRDSSVGTELGRFTRNDRPVPFELKSKMLGKLNTFSRDSILGPKILGDDGAVHRDLARAMPGVDHVFDLQEMDQCQQCDWSPQDCTIDMALVVRLSEAGTQDISVSTEGEIKTSVNVENNVRAVANVIQIKSGEGVVMAGLIGQRELETAAKVPVLGDLPVVGAAFRSKETLRQKTEVLIFLEAEVLDPRPAVARCQSGADYRLGQPFLREDLLDNPLECGFFRTGFGQYLPPACVGEEEYWCKFHRSVRKMKTHISDLLE